MIKRRGIRIWKVFALPAVSTRSIFGQAVLLVLIQVGGLGVITVAVGIMLLLKKRISIDNRIFPAYHEETNIEKYNKKPLQKQIFCVTIIFELHNMIKNWKKVL